MSLTNRDFAEINTVLIYNQGLINCNCVYFEENSLDTLRGFDVAG